MTPCLDDRTIGVATTRCIFIVALSAVISAPQPLFAQMGGGSPGQGRSESVRVTTRVPEPDRWIAVVPPNGVARMFKCKPDACAVAATVSFAFQKGSFTPPDSKALDRLANVELPKAIRAAAAARAVMTGVVEGIETLSSAPATLKNYPSIVNETKFTRGETSSIFVDTGVIFAGPLVIRVESKSPNRELAQKSLGQFVEAMQIVEVPTPGLPGLGAPRLPKTQSL